MKKLLVVADISNIYYCTQKKFGRKLDYSKFLDEIKDPEFGVGKPYEIYRAIAYGSEMFNEATGFKNHLRKLGFEIKYKTPKIYPSEIAGRENRKADWDVGIAVDVIRILPSVDIVVFATADGDLAPCLEYVESVGKKNFVFGSGISSDLRSLADIWIEISEHHLESPRDPNSGNSDEFDSSAKQVELRSGIPSDAT